MSFGTCSRRCGLRVVNGWADCLRPCVPRCRCDHGKPKCAAEAGEETVDIWNDVVDEVGLCLASALYVSRCDWDMREGPGLLREDPTRTPIAYVTYEPHLLREPCPTRFNSKKESSHNCVSSRPIPMTQSNTVQTVSIARYEWRWLNPQYTSSAIADADLTSARASRSYRNIAHLGDQALDGRKFEKTSYDSWSPLHPIYSSACCISR